MTKEIYTEKAKTAKKRGLQKFTDNEFLNNLLKQTKIGNEDLERLTPRQLLSLNDFLIDAYSKGNAEKKDEILNKVIDALPERTRNQIWEINHCNIMNAIIDYVKVCGGMPTKTKIAEYTGLSRPTIDKHFKDFKNNDLFKGIEEQIAFMIPKVMAEMLRCALNGDVRAAKLLLDYTGSRSSSINNQTNYIQINGVTYSDEQLKALRPEQLQTIEQILIQSKWEKPLFEDAEIINNR